MTISHPLSGRLPLLSAWPAVTFPAAEHHRPLAGIQLYCLVTETHGCEQLALGCYVALPRVGFELTICWSQVKRYLLRHAPPKKGRKSHTFLLCVFWAPLFGILPLEFHKTLWREKTTEFLSYDLALTAWHQPCGYNTRVWRNRQVTFYMRAHDAVSL